VGCWADGDSVGCWADGDSVGCGDDVDPGVCGGGNGLAEADNVEPRGTRGTRGISVAACWNLVRLVEWLGRGRL